MALQEMQKRIRLECIIKTFRDNMTKELYSDKAGYILKGIAELKSAGLKADCLFKELSPNLTGDPTRVNLDEVLDGHDRRTVANDTNGKHEKHWRNEIKKIQEEGKRNGR